MVESHEQMMLTTPSFFNRELDELIRSVAQEVVYPARFVFSVPGKKMEHIYYIKKGRTKHYMDNGEGVVKLQYTLTTGWFFGETPFFLGVPTGLYSQTETAATLYRIPPDQCGRLMRESDLFRDTIIQSCSRKMLILRYEIANLTFNSCKNRLKRLYCSSVDTKNIADPGWYGLRISYTHSELGEILGSARVTVSRQIGELCNEGFLRMVNRRAQVNIAKYQEYVASQH